MQLAGRSFVKRHAHRTGSAVFLLLLGVTASLTYVSSDAQADHINDTDFVTTWRITDPDDTSITIKSAEVNGITPNYNVDWNNDGVPDVTGITGNFTHDFEEPGDYTVRISGTYPRLFFASSSASASASERANAAKLLDVKQWGVNRWRTMQNMFSYTGLTGISAIDTPELGDVTSMAYMFNEAISFDADLSGWDTSNVNSMTAMFYGAVSFNGNIADWDTAKVTNTGWMFRNASSFNQDISSWNISGLNNMTGMFQEAISFNQDLTNWNTQSVTNMSNLFYGASAFNGDISAWNTSNV